MTELTQTDRAVDLASEAVYRYLAAALRHPAGGGSELLADPENQQIACAAAEVLREAFIETSLPLGFGELPIEELSLRAAVSELPATDAGRVEEFVRVFGLSTCRECPPYETEYHKAEEVFFRSQQMADVAGFYRAFGLAPGGPSRERPDHLALELEFVALLLAKQRLAADNGPSSGSPEAAAVCQQAHADFFRDHLSWWVPSFALALRRKADRGFYAEVGRVLGALMPLERARWGVAAPLMPLEAQLVETPDECTGCLAAQGG